VYTGAGEKSENVRSKIKPGADGMRTCFQGGRERRALHYDGPGVDLLVAEGSRDREIANALIEIEDSFVLEHGLGDRIQHRREALLVTRVLPLLVCTSRLVEYGLLFSFDLTYRNGS
jgi:hypothetical protein